MNPLPGWDCGKLFAVEAPAHGVSYSLHVISFQVNGRSPGFGAQGMESLSEDLWEFLGGEAPLHQLDDLTKVNPVTLDTGTGLPQLWSAFFSSVQL